MMKKWGKALREKEMQIAIEQRKNPETVEISGFSGCGDRTRTCDLRVMRSKQGVYYRSAMSCKVLILLRFLNPSFHIVE